MSKSNFNKKISNITFIKIFKCIILVKQTC